MGEGSTDNNLAHMVYFSLHDASPAARAQLVGSCQELLANIGGMLYFAVGTRAEELNRPVNVRDFDVALHIIFESQAAHERYQTHPQHLRFMAENRANWKMVRIFDATIDP